MGGIDMKNPRGTRKIYPFVVLSLLLVAPAASAEEPRLYTNADLANLPATDLPSSPATAPVVVDDEIALALAAPPTFEAREGMAELEILAGERVREARARVEELEWKLESVRDPFLPRPFLTGEEQRLWLHLDNVQRENLVSDELAEASVELQDAEAMLARARGAF
jgi:hypothetical protein